MTSLDLKNRSGTLAVAIAALAAASVFGADAAMAGADTTFNTALAQFTGFLEGSGGRIITVLSLAGGMWRLRRAAFRSVRSQSLWASASAPGPAFRSSPPRLPARSERCALAS